MAIRTFLPLLLAGLALTHDADAAKLKVPSQFPTIGAAIGAALPADEIVVAEGTYFETLSIIDKSDLTVRAKGKVVIDAQGAGTGIHVALSTDVRVKGFIVRDASDDGILVGSAPRTTIEDCRVKNGAGNGIRIHLSSGHEIADCDVKNVGGDGIVINASESYVHRNRIVNAGMEASTASILVTGSMNTLELNEIKSGGADGIQIGTEAASTSGNLLVENIIVGAAGDGIMVTQSDDTTLFDNVVRDVVADGIDISPTAPDTVIDRNLIVEAGSTGIELSSLRCDVTRNKVRKAGNDGLWVGSGAHDGRFHKNNIKKSTAYGFRLEGDDAVLTANVAKKSGLFDLSDTGASNSLVGNLFETIE